MSTVCSTMLKQSIYLVSFRLIAAAAVAAAAAVVVVVELTVVVVQQSIVFQLLPCL